MEDVVCLWLEWATAIASSHFCKMNIMATLSTITLLVGVFKEYRKIDDKVVLR